MTKQPESSPPNEERAWEQVLTSLCHLQRVFPDAVVVGGTASALYAHHRISFDHDQILPDLRGRFDQVLSDLEAVAGWETARVRRPHSILGSLDGIDTGVRQLRRSQPLETTTLRVGEFDIRLPTLPEILRIKAFLCLDRNATRDCLDLAALAAHQGFDSAVATLTTMDDLYPQRNGNTWELRTQLVKQLADPRPYDLDSVDLSKYKGIQAPFNPWMNVAQIGTALSNQLMHALVEQLKNNTSSKAQTTCASLKEWRDARERGETPPLAPLPGLQK